MRLLLFLCLQAIVLSGLGQPLYYPVLNIPVERSGITLKNPWTGGLNAPQFSNIDLNNDGRKDLFIFDRTGYKVLTFLNTGAPGDTSYTYAPLYQRLFPKMQLWAFLYDYNGDGVEDIFTSQQGETDPQGNPVPAGIKVYKGSHVNGNPQFSVVQYCLLYNDAPFTPAIWVGSLGLPAVIDVNHDGDADVLSFNIYGTAVEYYENQTRELGLPADSMRFIKVTGCWGNFYVSTSGNGISTNVSCKNDGGMANPGLEDRHGGATLWAIDKGNNGVTDLLISDSHLGSLYMVNNNGDSSYAHINWVDTLWPGCSTPANMPYFAAAFGVDADNDGWKDVLVAPNFATSALDKNNVLFYRNVPGDTCTYQFTGNDSFLVHTFIDLGTDAKPVFFDYNGDSLMDIVVGNQYTYNPVTPGISTLSLYKNTGTAQNPAYQLITEDYAGLSAYYNGAATLAIHPSFGDLDGDGKADLLTGNAGGTLYYFKNTGAGVAAFATLTSGNYFGIDVGAYSAPFIYDVNNDGLNDLLIGKQNGKLSYYWNFGTPTAAAFAPDSVNSNFGNVNVTEVTSTEGYSQPFISDSAGVLILYVGSNRGNIFKYLVDTTLLRNGTFTLLDSDVLKTPLGAKSCMQLYDLNKDGLPEILAGNASGGLQVFSPTVWDSTIFAGVNTYPAPNNLKVYPNPAAWQFYVEGITNTMAIQLYDLIGQLVPVNTQVQGSRTLVSVAAPVAPGLYFIKTPAGTCRVLIGY